jgi:glutamate synthase domain-containing protein 3
MTSPAGDRPVPTLSVPEVRDYQRINAELARLLDEGHPLVRLAGAEGQRLLAFGLTGAWDAVVEVEGQAGPELAAELDAPGLTVVCRGSAGDGAGRALRAGRLVILGDAGDVLGYTQQGGAIVAVCSAGHRAGLRQRGGVVLVLGRVGRLAAELQAGGLVFAFVDRLGPHPGHGRRGGRLVQLAAGDDPLDGIEPGDAATFRNLARDLGNWVHFPGAPCLGQSDGLSAARRDAGPIG